MFYIVTIMTNNMTKTVKTINNRIQEACKTCVCWNLNFTVLYSIKNYIVYTHFFKVQQMKLIYMTITAADNIIFNVIDILYIMFFLE